MSDEFMKKLQQKYGDQQSSRKPPQNIQDSDQETKENSDFFIDHNAFQDDSPKKKKGKSNGKNPKIKNKFFKDLADTVKENNEVDGEQQMDLIIKDKPTTVANTDKKNKFAQKVQHNKNRRNFQMGHTDQQYKDQLRLALQDAKQIQNEEQLDLVLDIPKICKGKNRHVDAAIFLKNTLKTKSSDKVQEHFSNSRVSIDKKDQKKLQDEQSIVIKKQHYQKVANNQCFKVTSLQEVKQNQKQLLDEDSQKLFKKMKTVSQAIKLKKQLKQWRQKKDSQEGVSSKKPKRKNRQKNDKQNKNKKLEDVDKKRIACLFQEEAHASDAQGQYSEDQQQQYDGVELNQQLADLIDNSQCFNENDGYIARRKFLQDDRLQDQLLIKKIKEGLLARKRRSNVVQSESEKKRRVRMQQVAKRFKNEDEKFLNNQKNSGKIDAARPIAPNKDQKQEQRSSSNERESQIKLLQEQLGNQKRMPKKQSISNDKKGEIVPINNCFHAIQAIAKGKPKSKPKQKKQKGLLGNNQKDKSIIAFNAQKGRRKGKSIQKSGSSIFLQIKDDGND